MLTLVLLELKALTLVLLEFKALTLVILEPKVLTLVLLELKVLTLVLLEPKMLTNSCPVNCQGVFFIQLKLELLMQFKALNYEKICKIELYK